MALPSFSRHGIVTGQFLVAATDYSSDADALPEFKAASGFVLVKPTADYFLNHKGDKSPFLHLSDTIKLPLDKEGFVLDPESLARGASLPATDDPDFDPINWTYEVVYDLYAPDGKAIRTLPKQHISVPAGETVDLIETMPVPASKGLYVYKEMGPQGPLGPQGIRGEKGVKGDAGPKGPVGPKGEKGDTGATGPKGSTGDQGIKGDTGDKGNTPVLKIGVITAQTNPADDEWVSDVITSGPETQKAIRAAIPANSIGPAGEKGDKGEAGAITVSIPLTSKVYNFDQLTDPGMYQWNQYAMSNGPANAQPYGLISVVVSGTTPKRITQTFYPQTTGAQSRVFYQRTYVDGPLFGWYPWAAYAAQRVDNTAGRAIYTWDDTNNREQLIYADTGWRNIASDLNPDYKCTSMTMRRSSNMVTINFDGIKSETATGHVTFYTPPSGFKPDTVSGTGNQRYGLVSDLSGNNSKVVSPDNNTHGLRFLSYVTNLTLHGSVTYFTRDPWPLELPGSPINTIPSY